jgi:beta-galactosidase
VKKLKGEHQSITHNFAGGFFEKHFDPNDMAKDMDFVSYDNYPVWGGLIEPLTPAEIAMNNDYIRGLKDKNYWIMEELMGSQGHTVIGYLPRPKQAQMWSYQAMAHGCKNLLYFRWRSMNKGAEQFCLGIVDHDNTEGRKYQEVKEFFNDISKYEDVINSDINSEIAVLYSFNNIWSWENQPQSTGFNFVNEILRLYTPFYKKNAHIDVIDTSKDISKYKVVVVPVMQIIDEKLSKKLEKFTLNGGTVIFSYRTGIKDDNNNMYFGKVIPCNVRELCGIEIKEIESLQQTQEVKIIGVGKYKDNVGICEIWRDLIIPKGAEVLAKYNDQFYKENACITVNNYGSGKAYYIGGGVSKNMLEPIVNEIIINNGIEYFESEDGIEVYKRQINSKNYLFVINHSSMQKEYSGELLEGYSSKIIAI